MQTVPTTRDTGIRSIFVTALGMEAKPATRWERLVDALDAELWRHVAIGTASGLVLAVASFAGLLALAPRDAGAEPEPAPIARFVSVDVTKADRQKVVGGKLAAVATAPTFADRTAGDISVALAPGAVTLDEPIAYAGQSSPAGAALAVDRMFDQPRVVTASLGDASITPPAILPDAAAPAVVEDDDDTNIIPVPRARPEIAVPVLPSILPRPRPNVPIASIAPPPEPPAATGAGAASSEPPPGLRPASGSLLGFFSTPSDGARPSQQSKSISIDTPFGVPYVLQQGSVETACLKPELVEVLRRIEGRFNKKVVITSGFRDRGRQGSLHRSCAAADIEVPGVDAASLASFARTIPDIGGVGTYCHPHMIHVDIGTPRDWKYGCGSYFAMRGGAPGKWGKVPGNLARNGMTGMSGMSGMAGDAVED